MKLLNDALIGATSTTVLLVLVRPEMYAPNATVFVVTFGVCAALEYLLLKMFDTTTRC